ncbi:MAG TPA: hypothetical protein VF720_09190 [Candidatus Eisenbacteria bacterium]
MTRLFVARAAMLTILIGALLTIDAAAQPAANPNAVGVPPEPIPVESPQAALHRMVGAALAAGTVSDEAALAASLGQLGLEPLSAAERNGIRESLDLFTSVLVGAQAPGYEPNWDIQLLLLERGSTEQRARMSGQLRRWFTESVRGADTNENCARVAEMLAEYGDQASTPAIRRWMDQGSVDSAQRERATRAVARIGNPCQGRWLTAEGINEVQLCPGAGLINVSACWYIDGSRDCGTSIPIESARYLARTIRLQTVRRVPLSTVAHLALAISAKSDIDVRIFPTDDARAIYIVERDMQASGLAWRADSPELAKWAIGWLKTAPPHTP